MCIFHCAQKLSICLLHFGRDGSAYVHAAPCLIHIESFVAAAERMLLTSTCRESIGLDPQLLCSKNPSLCLQQGLASLSVSQVPEATGIARQTHSWEAQDVSKQASLVSGLPAKTLQTFLRSDVIFPPNFSSHSLL